MELGALFLQIGISLGLGLLVGLQRERSASELAGVRTFPLITAFGTITALSAPALGGWVVAAGLVGLSLLILGASAIRARSEGDGPGLTTEVAALLMYAVGAYLVVGTREVAVAVGVLVAVLLHEKQRLHGLVGRMADEDVRAIMQFALLALVILPALPDRAFDPYGVLNPHRIWLMVVLIVGINIGGYVAYKLFGQGAGALVAGFFGGIISSTATTVSYARRTAKSPASAGGAAVVIMIASAVVFARLVALVAVLSPHALWEVGPPLALMFAWMLLLSGLAWLLGRGEVREEPSHANPSELKAALLFGALFAVVLFASAAAKQRFGDAGLMAVAGLSGLTDVDAITLFASQMMNDGALGATDAWRVILVATLSNLVFKGGAALALGGRPLFRRIALPFALTLGFGLALLVVGPSLF